MNLRIVRADCHMSLEDGAAPLEKRRVYHVFVTVEVRGAGSHGEAVEAVERRLQERDS